MSKSTDFATIMKNWEIESNSMYSGYVQSWLYEGQEYWVDSSKKEQMENMGAKLQKIIIAPNEISGWQQIDSVPEDMEVLVCVSYNIDDRNYETKYWVDEYSKELGWRFYGDRIDIPFLPTYWMHIPEINLS